MNPMRTLAVLLLAGAAVTGCSNGTPVASSPPSASTSRSPAPIIASPSVPPADAPIPDSAFFVPPKERTRTTPAIGTGRAQMPKLCGARYPSDARIGAMRDRDGLMYFGLTAAADSIPDGTVHQTIAVYQPGGAAAYVSELRDAVNACPSEHLDDGATRTNGYLTAFPAFGDESFAVQSTWTNPPEFPGKVTAYLAVIRVGDVVTTLYFVGWEDFSADVDVTAGYTKLAVTAVQAWRA